MAFILSKEEIEPGLVIFRRGDVKHARWYCRIKLFGGRRYKTCMLDTYDRDTARQLAVTRAREIAADVRQGSALFDPAFSEVAQSFLMLERSRVQKGLVSEAGLRKMEGVVARLLLPYFGTLPMHRVAKERWETYRSWRRGISETHHKPRVGDATIASEMAVFDAIMNYAVSKRYLAAGLHFHGRPKYLQRRREGFTREQFQERLAASEQQVDTARASALRNSQMFHRFIKVMICTGLRPGEAFRLRWQDISHAEDRLGTPIVVFSVQSLDRPRIVVAPSLLDHELEQIRAASASAEQDDPVFATARGTSAAGLYARMFRRLLNECGLRGGPGGVERSLYCLRHSYAMFRMAEGVSIYLLAVQMGTSVAFIEQYYGHAIAINHADRVLMGAGGWVAMHTALDNENDEVAKSSADTNAAPDPFTRDEPSRTAKPRRSSAKGQRSVKR